MSPPAIGSLLALHVTEPQGSLALAHAGAVHAVEFAAGGRQAPALLDAIAALLATARVRVADLQAIAVTTGPGSFTGIRVGLATAAGLAAARGWPVFACDSLVTRAAACDAGGAAALVVALDARRGEVFAAAYAPGDVPAVRVAPFCAVPSEAAARLALHWEAGARIAATGSGFDLVAGPLAATGFAVAPAAGPREPVAAALVRLAQRGGCARLAPEGLEPVYLRKSDAEARRIRPAGA